jgi:iron complex outermembrane receptor protein
LFGRNATGGAINFVTCDPKQEFAVDAEVGAYNYDGRRFRGHRRLRGAQRILRAVDVFAQRARRLCGQHVRGQSHASRFEVRLGKGRGNAGLEDQDAFALALRYDNEDALRVDYRFDYTDKRNSQLGVQLLGEYGFFNPTFDLGPTGGAPPPATISTQRLDKFAARLRR